MYFVSNYSHHNQPTMATAGPPEGSGPITDVNSVLNLSKLKLTPAMLSALNKGLSFCPSSPDVDFSNVMSGLDHLLRQKSRTAFFDRLSHLNDDFPSHNWLIYSTQSVNSTCQPFDHHNFKVILTPNQTTKLASTFSANLSLMIHTYPQSNPSKATISQK